MKITDEKIAELKAANPGVELHLLSDAGIEPPIEAVFRGPDYERDWKIIKSEVASGTANLNSNHNLLIRCLIFPDQATFLADVNRRPQTIANFATELGFIAGVGAKVTSKKL